jgi:hypothetical protein
MQEGGKFMKEMLLTAAALWLVTRDGNASPQGKGQANAGQVPKLKTTELEDGTGTIGLAPGWKITESYRGIVICKSPDGSGVVMGMPWTILRPDHPVTNMPERRAMGPVAIARVGDLPTALHEVLKVNSKARLISLRSRPAPSGLAGVPAVYFLYEFQRDGKTFVGLGYFSTIGDPNDGTLPYWQLYSSAVIAPKERFVKNLPTMMAMWNSWRPNGKKPREGSNGALMDAVKEANDRRAQENLKSQQAMFDRMNEKFRREVIGGS